LGCSAQLGAKEFTETEKSENPEGKIMSLGCWHTVELYLGPAPPAAVR
jgi:hypothetical protein